MSVRTVYDARSGQFGQSEGVFDPTKSRNDRFRDALMAGSRGEAEALRRAIWAHQFSVYYQPVVEVDGGRLIGAEALLRWHRDGEIVPAERFLRFAEDSGLVLRLGSRVLRDVAAFHARAGLPAGGGLRIAVNLSLPELLHPNIGETILDALDVNGRTASAIEVEVSEKSLAQDPTGVIAAVWRLGEAGIGCTLDDLGTSTLEGHLGLLPLLAVKVDLHAALRTEEALYGLTRLIEHARSFDLPVIAKGVSSYDHLELLSWLGVGAAQGYAMGVPAPASVFRGLLQDAGLTGDAGELPKLEERRRGFTPTRGGNGRASEGEPFRPRTATS